MATETLTIAAASSPTLWTLVGAVDKQTAVAANDGDTSYLDSTTTSGRQQQFAILVPSAVTDEDAIASVAVTAVCRQGGGASATYAVAVVLGANVLVGTARTAGSSYVATTDTLAVRPGTGAWTRADLASLQIRIQNNQARSVRCTQLFVTVNYTTTPSRLATTGDATVVATLWESVRAAGHFGVMQMPTADSTWAQNVLLATCDATATNVRNGVVRGYWPSWNWATAGREAILAPVLPPVLDPTLTTTERTAVLQRLLRRLITDLQATASVVIPSALRCEVPRTMPDVTAILTALGAQIESTGTENGLPVVDTVRGDLAMLSAALTAVGV